MTSREYWQEREAEQRKKNITDEAEYNREIQRIYQEMMDSIQKEIDAFYAKYADEKGITLAQAKRRVSELDIAAYSRKAAKYVKDKDFSDQANEEMRLYNLTMKVNRLEMLKAEIGLEIVSSFDELQDYFDQKLTDQTRSEFERQAGILGKTVNNPAQRAHAIVNASFHNAKWSERIWTNQTLLKSELAKLIQQGLIQGKSSRELARSLRKTIDVSVSASETLMSTEMTRVRIEAAKQTYERNGNEEYEFMTANPKGPCDECKKLDGKVFKVKDMKPGVNAPPIHPRCHCCTVPHWDEEEFQKYLDRKNREMHQRANAKKKAERKAKSKQRKAKSVAKQLERGIIEVTFPNDELRDRHYTKHQAEFDGLSIEEYIARANELANADLSDDVEHLTRSDESTAIYRRSTNEFLVITKDGKIKTFFKPEKKEAYWEYEHERNQE